jgi:crossover junction endodeoxyribonuclease RusA
LPWTTPPLSLNQRLDRHKKARLTREIREAAFLLAKHHKVTKGCSKIRVTLVYQPLDRRRRDAINLVPVLKAVEDGLVDARIVPDDTPVYLDPVMPQIHEPFPGQKVARLLVIVERLA